MSRPVRRTTPAGSGTPVRQDSVRAHNLALVFRQLLAAGGRPISRIELVDRTGLTRPTITRIVDELRTARLVTETGTAPYAGAGRPRVGLVLSRRGPAGLGLDIRGDCLAACVVDLTGTVRHLEFAPGGGPGRSADQVTTDLATLAHAAAGAAAEEELTLVGATVAVPGAVPGADIVRFAPALGWRDVDVGGLLRRALADPALPVVVENEARLAALGELYAGEEGLTDFVYVSGALGLGAGIVLNGRLLRGSRGWGGELGHVTVYPDGAPCDCGSRGCLQTYASLEVILGGAPDPAPAATILARADAGEPDTLLALETAGTTLGIALADLVNLVDVGTVLLGGGYAVLASWLVDRITAEVHHRALSTEWAPVEVRPAQLGPDAAVIGAALTSVDRVRQNPSAWLNRPGRRAAAGSVSGAR